MTRAGQKAARQIAAYVIVVFILRLPGRQGVGLIPLHTRRVQNRKGDGNGI